MKGKNGETLLFYHKHVAKITRHWFLLLLLIITAFCASVGFILWYSYGSQEFELSRLTNAWDLNGADKGEDDTVKAIVFNEDSSRALVHVEGLHPSLQLYDLRKKDAQFAAPMQVFHLNDIPLIHCFYVLKHGFGCMVTKKMTRREASIELWMFGETLFGNPLKREVVVPHSPSVSPDTWRSYGFADTKKPTVYIIVQSQYSYLFTYNFELDAILYHSKVELLSSPYQYQLGQSDEIICLTDDARSSYFTLNKTSLTYTKQPSAECDKYRMFREKYPHQENNVITWRNSTTAVICYNDAAIYDKQVFRRREIVTFENGSERFTTSSMELMHVGSDGVWDFITFNIFSNECMLSQSRNRNEPRKLLRNLEATLTSGDTFLQPPLMTVYLTFMPNTILPFGDFMLISNENVVLKLEYSSGGSTVTAKGAIGLDQHIRKGVSFGSQSFFLQEQKKVSNIIYVDPATLSHEIVTTIPKTCRNMFMCPYGHKIVTLCKDTVFSLDIGNKKLQNITLPQQGDVYAMDPKTGLIYSLLEGQNSSYFVRIDACGNSIGYSTRDAGTIGKEKYLRLSALNGQIVAATEQSICIMGEDLNPRCHHSIIPVTPVATQTITTEPRNTRYLYVTGGTSVFRIDLRNIEESPSFYISFPNFARIDPANNIIVATAIDEQLNILISVTVDSRILITSMKGHFGLWLIILPIVTGIVFGLVFLLKLFFTTKSLSKIMYLSTTLQSTLQSLRGLSSIDFSDIELMCHIKSGGYADVMKAIYNRRIVAVKVIRHSVPYETNNGFDARKISLEPIAKEIERLAKLNLSKNPNVVKLYGVCYMGDYVNIVMDYCEKTMVGELFDYRYALKREGLTREHFIKVLSIMKQIVDGMICIHNADIIHRDLKPDNILLDSEDVVKICDFGLATMYSPQLTSDSIVGTKSYIAPELRLNQPYGKPVDVYSFGIIMFEMLFDYKFKVSKGVYTPTEPKMQYNDWELAYMEVLEQCLYANPADRPTFEQLKTLLQEVKNVYYEYDTTLYPLPTRETDLSPVPTTDMVIDIMTDDYSLSETTQLLSGK